jgi:hypothetical protein
MIREDDLVFVRVADASDEKNGVALIAYRLNLIFALPDKCDLQFESSLFISATIFENAGQTLFNNHA